jgi:hypothetical protein
MAEIDVSLERALELTKKHGIRFKPPKTARGKRSIALDEHQHGSLAERA